VLLLALVSPVQACGPAELFSLIAERLSYMPAVAEYKYRRRLAVTDAAREQRVLENAAAQARELGLEAARVTPLVRAQMEAAKVIQRELIATWQQQGLQGTDQGADLLATIRPRLNQLGQRQLQLIQCMRQQQSAVEPGHRGSFNLAIADARLPTEAADDLFRSLLLIGGD
jgi:chorismate mutase